jgi:hypothetical protein
MKWKVKLDIEMKLKKKFESLSISDLSKKIELKKILSDNHDTVVSLDFPHYCYYSTESCGGKNGWCYTFQGYQSMNNHYSKVALIDIASEKIPKLLAKKISSEVNTVFKNNKIPYPNIRYCGSGEISKKHLKLLNYIKDEGIHLWGFTRNIELGKILKNEDISVIISIDKTSDKKVYTNASDNGLKIAYTSDSIDDVPPKGCHVVFPVHRLGKVKEVGDFESLCPKVVSEFFTGCRKNGTCQNECKKCH